MPEQLKSILQPAMFDIILTVLKAIFVTLFILIWALFLFPLAYHIVKFIM